MLRKLLFSIVVVATCITSTARAEVDMFFAANDQIRRVVNGVNTIVVPGGDPWGLAVDPIASKLYWTDLGTGVKRADFVGTNVESLASGGEVRGIDLDLVHGTMYWIDQVNNGFDKIFCANLDGSSRQEIVIPGIFNAFGIAVDPANGKVYWTDAGDDTVPGSDRISRANLDGSNVELLVNSDHLHGAFELALDVAGGKMYWADGGGGGRNGPGAIKRADLNGVNVETLVTGDLFALGIDLDLVEGKLYWGQNTNPDEIVSENLDGTNVQAVVTGNYDGFISSIAVIHIPEPSGLLIALLAGALIAKRRRN